MLAAIETGGTKVLCALVDESQLTQPILTERFPTTTPVETLGLIEDFLRRAGREHDIRALGVASFGPLNVEPRRPRYGWITGTSKPGWSNTKLLERIELASRVRTVLMSDVSGAALGEQRYGAGADLESVAYATFGTGVGVGIVKDGRLLHSNAAPEVGHLLVRRHPLDDFIGTCPFHGDCLEGLASGPAIEKRWGADASHLPGHVARPAFEIIGYYIAQAVAAVAYSTGVQRVVVGGGVLKAAGLLDEARRQLTVVSGGPLAGHPIAEDPFEFLAPPMLGDHSALLGAAAAANDLLRHGQSQTPVAPTPAVETA